MVAAAECSADSVQEECSAHWVDTRILVIRQIKHTETRRDNLELSKKELLFEFLFLFFTVNKMRLWNG